MGDKKRVRSSYNVMLSDVVGLLDQARQRSSRAVNGIMTATYWEIGRRIVEYEQRGGARAEYGTSLIKRISLDLTERFGRGFGPVNVSQMRKLYQLWPSDRIFQTMSEKSKEGMTSKFVLPWSCYVLLMSVDDPQARDFYETEAMRGGWNVRQLDRQISTRFFERTALSRNKMAMLNESRDSREEYKVSPENEIRDPLVLEFLGLKDEYSENDLEEALILHLESFLLELGGDFTFVGRQRRLRIGDSWYRVDLLFFHRRLRCLVVIDLKLGKLTHADAGQMHMYLNYARDNWTHAEENPPVGLIICAQKDNSLAHYALDNLPNKVIAAEYKMALPDERSLVAEICKTRKELEMRQKKR